MAVPQQQNPYTNSLSSLIGNLGGTLGGSLARGGTSRSLASIGGNVLGSMLGQVMQGQPIGNPLTSPSLYGGLGAALGGKYGRLTGPLTQTLAQMAIPAIRGQSVNVGDTIAGNLSSILGGVGSLLGGKSTIGRGIGGFAGNMLGGIGSNLLQGAPALSNLGGTALGGLGSLAGAFVKNPAQSMMLSNAIPAIGAITGVTAIPQAIGLAGSLAAPLNFLSTIFSDFRSMKAWDKQMKKLGAGVYAPMYEQGQQALQKFKAAYPGKTDEELHQLAKSMGLVTKWASKSGGFGEPAYTGHIAADDARPELAPVVPSQSGPSEGMYLDALLTPGQEEQWQWFQVKTDEGPPSFQGPGYGRYSALLDKAAFAPNTLTPEDKQFMNLVQQQRADEITDRFWRQNAGAA